MHNPREVELLRSLLPIGTKATLEKIFERTSIRASELTVRRWSVCRSAGSFSIEPNKHCQSRRSRSRSFRR